MAIINNYNLKQQSGILSIQSHVAYGYVGNKAAVYPLQSMGYDVWPVNTVQFSNHTGYGQWQGEIFSREHIRNILQGIEHLGVLNQCCAILSGYMGSADICYEVFDIVNRLKHQNSQLLYLCDPVIGNTHCYVKPEVLNFFKTKLIADIITPNQFEAEILSGIKITNTKNLKLTLRFFHDLGIQIVVITGVKLFDISSTDIHLVASKGKDTYIIKTKEYNFPKVISGAGDLLSAIYLGSYIATKSIIQSLQISAYYMDKVMGYTLQSGAKELQVTKISYDTVLYTNDLPRVITI
ncbi:MAG: pyridoxal kinase [Amoebophilaceae bacterium]|nr:pyridoxal kinase [Amoebophilaceae bacterium]